MCGICGVIQLNQPNATTSNEGLNYVTNMLPELISRGPDAEGMMSQNNISFGHRRLKIFDLSQKSQQPMHDANLGLTVVYNGAIYNYRELRRDLEEMGYSFFSSGDTEVLLKAYHAWGNQAFQKLNGMFAAAIMHRDSGKVVLARDRLGIKPLYYSHNSERLIFASTLPAILRGCNDVDKEIDSRSLHHYMTFHSVVPAPHTILRGVKKVIPGTIMSIEENGAITQELYWQLQGTNDSHRFTFSFSDWKQLLHEKLKQAVTRRNVADVPVGVLLSGGLDSSLVVALLAEVGAKDIQTFSIGFDSVNGEEGNEFHYSDIIAKEFGTTHHKIQAGDLLLSSLEDCVRAMSEPMVSHDCIGFYLLSQEVSQHVKVVQSGQGADEIFGGYHWYPPMMLSDDPVQTYRDVFFDGDHQNYLEAVSSRFHELDYSTDFIKQHFHNGRAQTSIDKALLLDTTVMLIDDPVKRVDNMTMAWGLEARVPFLDHELVEFAMNIPPELKVNDGGKYILKESARELIPDEVIDRPKGYFPVPALKYLRGEYYDFVHSTLTSLVAKNRRLFNSRYVEKVLEAPDKHITPLRGSRLWQMALLHYWLDIQGI